MLVIDFHIVEIIQNSIILQLYDDEAELIYLGVDIVFYIVRVYDVLELVDEEVFIPHNNVVMHLFLDEKV